MELCRLFVLGVVSLILLYTTSASAYLYKINIDTSNGSCEDEKFGQISVGEKGYNYAACELIFCLRGVYYRQGCDEKPMKSLPNCRRVARPGVYPTCCHKKIECDDEEADFD
ncbi:hypothetical protein HNY73_001612 [Argiope bruennichi]|uniref:Single domain-containing protein n=1 Tax=Argiope bruennichi TaxID=94029 RepID=A0A8T0FQU7_ARGBR|nr:hypothetical protein HNY73_001612 [Argiope bruennichi]